MEHFKTVLNPIKVPVGDYCWGGSRTCKCFDNGGGHPYCLLGFHPVMYDNEGRVPKPKICWELEGKK